MYYRLNGKKIDLSLQQESAGETFPAFSLFTMTDRWGALGITEHADETLPDATLYSWVVAPDGTYTTTSLSAEEKLSRVASAILTKKADCEALAAQKRMMIVGNTSPAEMSSWPIKRAEAAAYNVSQNVVDAPILSTEATARGVALAALVGKVLVKAAAFANYEALISGTSGKHSDALTAIGARVDPVPTESEVAAYDLTTDWPF